MNEIISTFLVDSCTVEREKHVNYKFITALTFNSGEPDVIETAIAGSISEMYINPMLSCCGDVDLIVNDNSRIAVVTGSLGEQLQLPSIYCDHVQVYEIIDSKFPGYVFLSNVGVLKLLSGRDSVYEFFPIEREENSSSRQFDGAERESGIVHGSHAFKPITDQVIQKELRELVFGDLPLDANVSIRCHEWPTQAADWPIRCAESDWPDAATIEYVVSNGCNLVQVAHRHCKQDEWMSTHQWRLSFSNAETILLNSWTPIQQIVYHILRFVFRHDEIGDLTDDSAYKILSNYHLKTSMMWTCTIEHSSWWMQNNLVKLCSSLFKHVASCCELGSFWGYFVMSNLFEFTDGCSAELRTKLVSRLKPFTDSAYLTTWLFRNYVGECVKQCPSSVQRLFGDISTDDKLRAAMKEIIPCRSIPNHVNVRIEREVINNFQSIIHCNFWRAGTVIQQRRILNNGGDKFIPLFSSMISLSLASQISTEAKIIDPDTLDRVSALLLTVDNTCTAKVQYRTLLMRKAISLLRSSVTSSCTTDGSILLFLSHAYVLRALSYDHNGSDEYDNVTLCLHVYLAVIYCLTGDYKAANNHCKLVTGLSQSSTQRYSYLVEGRCLPKIGNDIDTALGLVVLYQFLMRKRSNKQQQRHECAVFSPNLFASYLQLISCNLNETLWQQRERLEDAAPFADSPAGYCQASDKPKSADCVQRYRRNFRETTSVFVSDLLLYFLANRDKKWTSPERQSVKPTTRPSSIHFTAVELRRLLIEYSVQQLTVYHEVVSRSQGDCRIVTSDIAALFAFQCGAYKRCIEMCQLNIAMLSDDRLPGGRLVVPLCGNMTQLIDDNLAAVAATAAMMRSGDNPLKAVYYISQLTLSIYLLIECKLKLKHPMTSLVGELDRITRVRYMYRYNGAEMADNEVDEHVLSFSYRRLYKLVQRELRTKTFWFILE